MYDPLFRHRALESHVNESHTTARVEKELESTCDQKEHVSISDLVEKSWPARFGRKELA